MPVEARDVGVGAWRDAGHCLIAAGCRCGTPPPPPPPTSHRRAAAAPPVALLRPSARRPGPRGHLPAPPGRLHPRERLVRQPLCCRPFGCWLPPLGAGQRVHRHRRCGRLRPCCSNSQVVINCLLCLLIWIPGEAPPMLVALRKQLAAAGRASLLGVAAARPPQRRPPPRCAGVIHALWVLFRKPSQ